MKHEFIIDIEQIKEEKLIIIKIKNYPMIMGEKIFSSFSKSLVSFLKIFYEATTNADTN